MRKLDRHVEALAEYDKALQRKPEDFFLRFFRANTLQELRRDVEATGAYERAQQVAPHHSAHSCQRPPQERSTWFPGGDQLDQQPNAPRRGRRAKSREAVRDEEVPGSNKDEAHP